MQYPIPTLSLFEHLSQLSVSALAKTDSLESKTHSLDRGICYGRVNNGKLHLVWKIGRRDRVCYWRISLSNVYLTSRKAHQEGRVSPVAWSTTCNTVQVIRIMNSVIDIVAVCLHF